VWGEERFRELTFPLTAARRRTLLTLLESRGSADSVCARPTPRLAVRPIVVDEWATDRGARFAVRIA
jgi:hypothetical protein